MGGFVGFICFAVVCLLFKSLGMVRFVHTAGCSCFARNFCALNVTGVNVGAEAVPDLLHLGLPLILHQVR